jgi:hypothetical protein
MKERKPIFYDAERVRWRFTRRILEVSGVLLTLLLVYFFVTIARSVELPSSLLPDTRPAYHSLKKKLMKPVVLREGRHKRIANIGQVPSTYDPLRAAFFVSWEANSLASLKKHYKDIDLLMPEQLHAITPDGALTIVDYELYETVKVTPTEAVARLKQDKLHQWMRSTNPPIELPIMGLLNNSDGTVFKSKELAELLASSASRKRLIADVTEFAVESNEVGIVVDFEEIPEKSQPAFKDFIREFAPALHGAGLKLMVALPARDNAFDYAFFGRDYFDELRPALADVPARTNRGARLVRGESSANFAGCSGTENCGGNRELRIRLGGKDEERTWPRGSIQHSGSFAACL